MSAEGGQQQQSIENANPTVCNLFVSAAAVAAAALLNEAFYSVPETLNYLHVHVVRTKGKRKNYGLCAK